MTAGFVFATPERAILRRLNDARRVHVLNGPRRVAALALCKRGYCRIVEDDGALLVIEPTAQGVQANPWETVKPGGSSGPSVA